MREERSPAAGRPVAVAAMIDERGAQGQLRGTGMTGTVECRYYGRDFTAREMALLRALNAGPTRLTRHALSAGAHRLGQARRRPQGHDGQSDHAGHASRRLIILPPPRWGRGRPKPIVSGPDTEAPLFPATTTLDEVRPLDLRTVRARHPGGQTCGTSSSPATTTSATRPWSAPRWAAPPTTATAGRSPCSATQPPRGSSPRATASSAGRRRSA